MAKKGKVAKRTYCNYESGDRVPDVNFLVAIADAGADVNYLLTGRPSGERPPPAPDSLSDEERRLLGQYRRLSAAGRGAVAAVIDQMGGQAKPKASPKVVIHGKVGQQTQVDGDLTIESMHIDMGKD